MSIRKITRMLFIAVLVLVMCVSASFAGEDKTVLTVGSQTFKDSEVLRLIAGGAQGNEMMAKFMLVQTSLEDRRQIANDISDAALIAEGARAEGLEELPDVAFQIKWQTVQILIQAYFDKISETWDSSEAAVRRYYDAHRADFMQTEAVKASHILSETESDAIMAMLAARGEDGFEQAANDFSIDKGSGVKGGDLGWVEKGMMVPEVEEAIMNGRSGQIVGPVKSTYGWHVIKIGERRPARQLTFKEAASAALGELQTEYINQELARLRAKYPVTINEEALENLGGVPAPKTAEDTPAK